MNERRITTAELVLFAGTRVALGIGVGLLISRGLNNDQRKAAGIALTVIGAASTIPLVINIRRRHAEPKAIPVAA